MNQVERWFATCSRQRGGPGRAMSTYEAVSLTQQHDLEHIAVDDALLNLSLFENRDWVLAKAWIFGTFSRTELVS